MLLSSTMYGNVIRVLGENVFCLMELSTVNDVDF